MRKIFLVLGVFLSGIVLYSADTITAKFLLLYPDASSFGTGGAYTGYTKGSSSLYWNPAGLSSLSNSEITVSHMVYIEDLKYNFISYAEPMGSIGSFGIGGIILNSGDILKTEEDPAGSYVSTGESFKTKDVAILFGWGKKFGEKFSAGLSLKYINIKIANDKSNGTGLDFGMKYQISKAVGLGINLCNFGKKINEENLPTNIRTGLSITNKKLVLNLDTEYNFYDKEIEFSAGIERRIRERFILRIGYNSRSEVSDLSKLNIGFGIDFKSFRIDYAFSSQGDLGNINIFSFSSKF